MCDPVQRPIGQMLKDGRAQDEQPRPNAESLRRAG
jgi:hypothetical protein